MLFSRKIVVSWAVHCVGIKEGSNEHRMICSTYNGYAEVHKLPKIGIKDSWCACFVSACFIAGNCSSIIPCEISCERMINKSKSMGIWQENDNYIPKSGDVICYDWQDNGVGDCKGWCDHVGIVELVENDRIHVIEGNKNDEVGRRIIKINSRYIRGFITPRFNNA